MNTTHKIKGFTLLEILLVIAAIGILAAIVLVAINPNRQLAQARNAQRRADINTIYKALEQYLIDTGSYPNSINTNFKEICNTGSQKSTDTLNPLTLCDNKADLRALVPNYVASIPIAPSGGIYRVGITGSNNRIGIEATNSELNQTIAINRQSWTPAQISTALWLDAADISTVVLNGEKVSEWRDKSGNGRHASQEIASRRPTFIYNRLNFRPVISFDDASSNALVTPAFLMGNTVATVAQRSNTGQPIAQLLETSLYRGLWGDAYPLYSTHLNYGVHGASQTSNPPNSAVNTPVMVVGTQSQLSSTYKVAFGEGSPSYSNLQGFIAEVVVTSQILSMIERQQLEGYLAHKWGLTANLPSDHPYKNTPPNP